MSTHVSGTDPYPWPYDGRLDARRIALVVAGNQPHWAAMTAAAEAVTSSIESLAQAVRAAGGLVVLLRHGHVLAPPGRRAARLATVGSPAWRLLVPCEDGDVVVDAAGIDGFHGSCLDDVLRTAGRDQLLMCGLAGELTVDSTLRSANDRGYECLVVADAVAHLDALVGARSLASVTMSGGIFGAVGRSPDVLHALDPTTPPTPPRPLEMQ